MFTIDPTKATKQLQDFTVPVGSMFIADVVEEHARVLQEAERRMRREELLAEDDSSVAFDADKFAADGPQVCVLPTKSTVQGMSPFHVGDST